MIKTQIDYEEEIDDVSRYIEWVPRVSDVVSFIFPFEWDWKNRYLKWLDLHWVDQDEYLLEAQQVGTFVHKQIENFIKWIDFNRKDKLLKLHSKEITHWASFIMKELMSSTLELRTEQYIIDSCFRYQWTADLVVIDEINKTVEIYDWKTWWIAKKKWELKNEYKKPYDKIKKVALQLSLYAEYYRKLWYTIKWLYVVWLHETWAYKFSLDIYNGSSIDELLKNWNKKQDTEKLPQDILLHINRELMQVRVNTNIKWMAYTNAEIVLEAQDCEGMTFEEKIEEAIRLQKELVSKY